MAIGKPRGKVPRIPVTAYDPAVKRKRYIGSYDTRAEAEAAEEAAHQRFVSAFRSPFEGRVIDWESVSS